MFDLNRMNPLTIGFYPASSARRPSPAIDSRDEYPKDPFSMLPAEEFSDRVFQSQMDLESAITRRRYEITISQGCRRLKELDGLDFRKEELLREDKVWEEIKKRGLIANENEQTAKSKKKNKDIMR
ncbi:Protein nud1 [Rhizina undulata]